MEGKKMKIFFIVFIIFIINFRCVINLRNTTNPSESGEIMFHISMRPSEQTIVRNAMQHNCWGPEERGGAFVRANKVFEFVIVAEREYYRLQVNGSHSGTFRHRLPLHLVQYIQITGEVTINQCSTEKDSF
jgi:hypothetical protein